MKGFILMLFIKQRSFYYLFALVWSFTLSTSVFASAFNWQGPYVGFYLGGGLENNQVGTSVGNLTDSSYFTSASDINAVNTAGSWTEDSSAVILGIQAGHDWTWKHLLYGIALDYGMFSLEPSHSENSSYPSGLGQFSTYTSSQTNWLFTLRGRLGYHIDLNLPSLFYLTGGMAMTQLQVSNSFNDNSTFVGIGSSSVSQNQIGWVAGIGIETVPFNHISVNFEYLYVDMPSAETTGFISNTEGGFGIPVRSMTSSFSTTTNLHANLFKVGLNYRFAE
jgi:opacity protein-like surface antigen